MKHYLIIAGVAVLAYFVVAAIQQKVMPIPLVGNMLPR
jgi:hypothetical protein